MTVSVNLQWLYRLRYPVFLALSSVVAFVVVIYFFSPRFVIWKGLPLDTPAGYSNPEVNRAMATLKKIDNPFRFVQYPGDQNADINWRLLFPLLGHYLHIPRLIFFALPHLGCLFVLALVAHVMYLNTGNRLLAWATATLAGTTSWFFVSTGWLTYFDSYYVLGLLVVAFVQSRWVMAGACLLAPWVDERFVITAAIALGIRAVYLKWFHERAWSAYGRDVMVFGAVLGPYLLVRWLMTMRGADVYPVSYHLRTYNFLLNFHTPQLLESIWTGLRAAWFFVACVFWLSFPPGKRWWSALALGGVLAIETVLMALAGDFSRNMSTLLPAVVLGVLLVYRARCKWLGQMVALTLCFNLLAPAVHGFNTWRLPIANLYTEIENYKRPPDHLNPFAYNKLAVDLANRGDLTNALTSLNSAVVLKPKFADALFNRAIVRRQLGDEAGAAADLTAALKYRPPNWPDRYWAEQILTEIQQRR